ncbi:glycosyltransferase family 9 protein [Fusobacterium sp.]|uniref:glycosyltransferase family 9 protein n=1 Tax=Fusobacterium sp. TaxID=68766 RepID=UPI0025B84AC3|nr:glycosyltransferase family 9 protein [Fusobacterium sp.]
MGKIRILKTSYLKRKIKEYLIKLSLVDYKFLREKKESKNLLIITLDALGDNIVKSKTIEILTNEFGKENTYILCKSKWKSIYELQDYKNIFVDETKWSVFYKIKQYRKLNRIGFNTVAIMNHSYIPEEADYILSGEKYDMSENVDYILDKHIIILKKILGKEFNLDDVKPDMGKYFLERKYKNIISIAIGTADYIKTPTYLNLKKYIQELLKYKKEIYVLGSGEKQKKIAEKLKEEIKSDLIIDCIDTLTLKEVIQVIKDSELFIGGDSGLYNIAFSLGVNTICLHWSKEKTPWEHKEENIKILKGKGGREFIDKKYGTDILNSITFEQIQDSIEKLNILMEK